MGKTIVHAGGSGNGQAAKICNNMILGVSMIGVSEAFILAEKLGLDAQRLFDIASKSSGQCWSITSYCPVPGPVPTSPANRDYQAGFTAAMMLKDLKLAQDAARGAQAVTPLGAAAAELYGLYTGHGHAAEDFSGIIRFLRGSSSPTRGEDRARAAFASLPQPLKIDSSSKSGREQPPDIQDSTNLNAIPVECRQITFINSFVKICPRR